MAIAAEVLSEIQAALNADGSASERYGKVRALASGLSVTQCDASDVDTETPVMETSDYAVYLIDTSEHCVRITTQPEAATGLILARKR